MAISGLERRTDVEIPYSESKPDVILKDILKTFYIEQEFQNEPLDSLYDQLDEKVTNLGRIEIVNVTDQEVKIEGKVVLGIERKIIYHQVNDSEGEY